MIYEAFLKGAQGFSDFLVVYNILSVALCGRLISRAMFITSIRIIIRHHLRSKIVAVVSSYCH